jgi:hypothetical protein
MRVAVVQKDELEELRAHVRQVNKECTHEDIETDVLVKHSK